MKRGYYKNQILSILLESKEPITVKELSEEISVSGKTIRNYLKEIDEKLKKMDIKLIKKPNYGVYLEVNEASKSKLNEIIKNSESNYEIYSPQYRKKYILKTLFKNKDTYTIQLLADDLYCSKSTIVNDLIYVQKWLENYGLLLKRKQNQGLWIEGCEKDFRKAMMNLFYELDKNYNLDTERKIVELDYRIDFDNYERIKQLFPRIDLIIIQRILQEAEKKLGNFFTDGAFINLIIHIAITMERVKLNKEIKMEKNLFDTLKKNNEFNIASWVVEELSKSFCLEFPEDEIGYISLHMIGSKVQQNIESDTYDVILEKSNKEYVDIAMEITNLVSDVLNTNLRNDKLLQIALVLHLKTTLVRIKHGLDLRNPLLNNIKTEYTSIFGAAWACNSIFEKKLGSPINEDEIAYLALHFAVALSRVSNKLKTVIVCASGVGTSQLLTEKLRHEFEELEIIATLPYSFVTKEIMNEADLMISTVQALEQGKDNCEKVIYVNSLLQEKDIRKIKKFIRLVNINNVNIASDFISHEKSRTKKKVIEEEFCFIEDGTLSFEDVINRYGNLLISRGYAKPGFIKNILNREEIQSTVVGKGIAIPHSTEEYVNKSKVCIVKLENPIEWKNEKIDIIVILCLKFTNIKATKYFFKNLYAVMNNEEVWGKILKSHDKKFIVKVFENGGMENERFN